jgi:ceramide glucosyltransferase
MAGLGWLFVGLSMAGIAYTILAAVFVCRFFQGRQNVHEGAGERLSPTILKPLHGAESGLQRNLESFFRQDAAGPVQIVMGLQDAADPAIPIIKAMQADHADVDAILCVSGAVGGYNRKIANLINMWPSVKGDLIILSDSDIGVAPDYLRRVAVAASKPQVGVVTCPYFGKPEAGFWSGIAAMGLSYQFLANVITGVSLGMASPCMGSTIALPRDTLRRIGGFEAFKDTLADDYAIGAAVRGLGLKSVVAPILVSHSCTETSFRDVFAHELRWAKTVKGVDPAGHAGSVVTHPLPLALIAAVFLGFSIPSLIVLAAACLSRVWLMRTVDRVIGRGLGPWWLIPLRDMLSFFVFVGSFFVRSVEWRGTKFHVSGDGDLKPV